MFLSLVPNLTFYFNTRPQFAKSSVSDICISTVTLITNSYLHFFLRCSLVRTENSVEIIEYNFLERAVALLILQRQKALMQEREHRNILCDLLDLCDITDICDILDFLN
jgi:hypothetical protein